MSNGNAERDPQGDLAETQEQLAAANAEIEEMHAELTELRRRAADDEVAGRGQRHLGRRWAVGLLIVLGCIVLAGANVSVWLRDVVLDADAWVAAVGPLSQNEVIVNTVSVYVVGELFDALDVEQVVREALPDPLNLVSGPLVGVLEDLVRDTVASVIESDQFNAVWVAVNRTAHEVVIGVLRGGTDYLYIKDGQLTLDFSDIFDSIQSTLDLESLGLFADQDGGKFVIFNSYQVAMLQQVLAIIDTVGLWLPILALAAFVAAWLLSLWRRRTILWIGVGVAITMGLTLLLFSLVQPMVLASIVDPIIRLVAGEILKVVLNGLVLQTVLLLIIGLLIAVGAELAGPHPRAVAIRTTVSGWLRPAEE